MWNIKHSVHPRLFNCVESGKTVKCFILCHCHKGLLTTLQALDSFSDVPCRASSKFIKTLTRVFVFLVHKYSLTHPYMALDWTIFIWSLRCMHNMTTAQSQASLHQTLISNGANNRDSVQESAKHQTTSFGEAYNIGSEGTAWSLYQSHLANTWIITFDLCYLLTIWPLCDYYWPLCLLYLFSIQPQDLVITACRFSSDDKNGIFTLIPPHYFGFQRAEDLVSSN